MSMMINPSGKSGQVIATGEPFKLRLKRKRPAETDAGTERDTPTETDVSTEAGTPAEAVADAADTKDEVEPDPVAGAADDAAGAERDTEDEAGIADETEIADETDSETARTDGKTGRWARLRAGRRARKAERDTTGHGDDDTDG